jgi:hypothetical protein
VGDIKTAQNFAINDISYREEHLLIPWREVREILYSFIKPNVRQKWAGPGQICSVAQVAIWCLQCSSFLPNLLPTFTKPSLSHSLLYQLSRNDLKLIPSRESKWLNLAFRS